jgi:hypothetical protein
MEDLREKVYECTLPVEAHMICDLLARAGISARVDGEFLAGAGGELPMGSNVKVRVDPSRAAEARQVIDEWERLQPPPDPAGAVKPRSSLRSPLIFIAGVMIGAVAVFVALRSPSTLSNADFDNDGITDEIYHYSGNVMERIEFDRNADGNTDALWLFDHRGVPKRYDSDDDFDGRYEWKSDTERGQFVTGRLDANGDGRSDLVMHSIHGVLHHVDVYDEAGQRVVARRNFEGGLGVFNNFTEFDGDGDGVFERRVEFDRYGEPKTR